MSTNFAWFCLIFLVSQVFAQVCVNVTPPCFPNYYYVGSGYDSRYASPVEIVTGLRQAIVEYSGYQTLEDGKWGYPNGIAPVSYPACTSNQNSNTISGAFAIHKETTETVSTSIGIGSLYTGSSSTFTSNAVTDALKYNSYSYDSYQICSQYALALNLYNVAPFYNLTSQFTTAVGSLPSSFNPNNISSTDSQNFEAFYKTYGDAFIAAAIEGGLITQRSTLDAYSKANLESQDISVSQQAQVSFDITIGESTTSTSNSSSLQAFQQNATFSEITVIGGNPSYENDFESWQNSLVDSPLPVIVKLSPIYVWMNEDYFPNDNQIANKAQAYSEYTQWYLETQNSYDIFIPFFNVAMGEQDEYQASSTVSCPEGSVILSGGCSSTQISGDDWPWRITGSVPQVNSGQQSWECTNGEDDGVNYKHLKTFSVAMCSPQSYDVAISSSVTQSISVATKMVSETSDSSQKYNNSATATCPSGWYVVGGGCSVSDYTNNHPWITRASYPKSSSSWYCMAAEDYNTQNHDVAVTSYAMCAQWTTNLTYVTQLPKNYQIVSCNSGTGGQYANSCTSKCPSGYYLAGGGCSVGNLNDLDWPWRLTSSYPQDNGWYCLAGQDRGRGETYISVLGYAICIQF
mmetsp:Transcript_49256/g.74950  ORF Transcript_49256/g.74950 Transcript_49256/m.74950 type:complete len:630 (+) Transcript_49256:53-1942(+)